MFSASKRDRVLLYIMQTKLKSLTVLGDQQQDFFNFSDIENS